ncbi:MAG: hypothetical protein GWN61_08395 [candidate division Zixibacteria bacterium]|nr:hypothetical protein [candidate division Zixibacteria bacterium]NIT71273.1 hypothetical protein [candidate division KSB1 bacterium]NIW44976.1 hypothetical protein [Gammaproteobacteria bacterium]NIS46036.1 hypothetical protein [candidate division Zixibacteria bacterium]NIU14156.1 hypothetical protein [candidate division Zixibacteria bacterium]
MPDEPYTIELGKADIKRIGDDLTIVSYGLGVHWALEVAETLSKEGAEIEVLDLCSLIPWDKQAVLSSIRKTNRAVILHEANLTGGIGAEIAAVIAEEGFTDLDAPVMRLASLDTPIPFNKQMEQHIYWPKDHLPEKVRRVLEF